MQRKEKGGHQQPSISRKFPDWKDPMIPSTVTRKTHKKKKLQNFRTLGLKKPFCKLSEKGAKGYI